GSNQIGETTSSTPGITDGSPAACTGRAREDASNCHDDCRSRRLGCRRHFLDGALPTAFGHVEYDALGRLVFDLVVDIRAGLLAAGHVAAARSRDRLVDLLDTVDPHAEVHQAAHVLLALEARDRLVAKIEKRDVHDSIGHVDATLRVAG